MLAFQGLLPLLRCCLCVQYWKGDHIISVTQKIIEEHLRAISHQKNIEIDISRLHWTPYPTQTGKK